MIHPRATVPSGTGSTQPADVWPDSELPADQLNSLEQLLESFGQTPAIVQALAEGLADLRGVRQDMDASFQQRFDALWDVVVLHTAHAGVMRESARRRPA
ncbi:hypothetical protein AACH06_26305 [Ideonella sp. DXS29W]|uniref:Uncharacterized protein n=1 Tax=Ideonella lacteola TaxID=2984193 RepID=A0ABU9C0J3_9BURK